MNTKIALSVPCLLLVTLKTKVLHPPQNNCSLLVLEKRRTVPSLYELLNGNFADMSHTKLNLLLINVTTKNVVLSSHLTYRSELILHAQSFLSSKPSKEKITCESNHQTEEIMR